MKWNALRKRFAPESATNTHKGTNADAITREKAHVLMTPPPSYSSVVENPGNTVQLNLDSSFVQPSLGPTPSSHADSKGFQLSDDMPITGSSQISKNLTALSMELHVNTRGTLLPDPRFDEISAICYMIRAEEGILLNPKCHTQETNKVEHCGILIVGSMEDEATKFGLGHLHNKVKIVNSEVELIDAFVQVTQEWDPDFYVGYELQKSSFGYFIKRAEILELNPYQSLSRIPLSRTDHRNESDVRGKTHASGLWILGRNILNLWRVLRSEV